ncbi:MAG: CarD family transcriptional regulator [Anaerolineae bacterium]
MAFQIGDTVIHPGYGAGTVVDIGKLNCLGSGKPYYSIELADGSKTRVWVPVRDADKRGVRRPTPLSQLGRIWHVLSAGPEPMSADHDERSERLQEKLRGGDAFRVAEVVRDMFWQSHRSRRLSILDKELYDKGLALLTSEVAVVLGCALAAAEAEISDTLAASLAAQPAV